MLTNDAGWEAQQARIDRLRAAFGKSMGFAARCHAEERRSLAEAPFVTPNLATEWEAGWELVDAYLGTIEVGAWG
jgi:hypothetical protein